MPPWRLTFLALLALALPSTGPVRGSERADIQVPAQEASLAYSDPMGESGLQESPDWRRWNLQRRPFTNEAK